MSLIILQGLGSPLIITQGLGMSGAGVYGRSLISVGDYALYVAVVDDVSETTHIRTPGMYHFHDLGDAVQLSVEFTDAVLLGNVDPSVVNLSVRSPDGVVTTLTYGSDAGVVKDDVGQYHAVIDANQSGVWHYRWWSTGTGQAAEERRFQVRAALAVEA